jgi:hypothetical protein
MWVAVGFGFENPHQTGLSFSNEEWFDVRFPLATVFSQTHSKRRWTISPRRKELGFDAGNVKHKG